MTRTLTPSDAFAAIDSDRILVLEMEDDLPMPMRGTDYVVKISDNAYRFYSQNASSAPIDCWTWDRRKARSFVTTRLRGDYCKSHRFVQWRDLSDGVTQSLRKQD